ncbi:MAG: GntR family transcriptional regulator [Dermatophilus congolensis]|nr:GntR family transcriptional regulator [Dermatophilus congolensis]
MTQLDVRIDRSSPVPLYHQLAEQLTQAIEDGTLKPGDPFENELSIADRLALSRPTVRRAIGELVSRGLLVRRRGVGTTVANRVVHRRDELTSLYDDLERTNREPRTEVLGFDTAAENEKMAAILQVEPSTPLVLIERLRYAGDEPLALMTNWLPPSYADITKEELAEHGLYALLRQRGARPIVAHQTIGARAATAQERRLLGTGKSVPLLTMVRHAYAADGTPIEVGDHCYRADQYAFDITVRES